MPAFGLTDRPADLHDIHGANGSPAIPKIGVISTVKVVLGYLINRGISRILVEAGAHTAASEKRRLIHGSKYSLRNIEPVVTSRDLAQQRWGEGMGPGGPGIFTAEAC